MTAFTLVMTILLSGVHLTAGKLTFLSGTPRSIWLSIAGGISVTYVFIHLLPELSQGQASLVTSADVPAFLEHHVYLISLGGLVIFYGLERAAKRSKRKRAAGGSSPGVFQLHLASFSIYNGIIGYLLLHREDQSLKSLLLYVLAMALHFIVNDFGLHEHYGRRYEVYGRWILALTPILGWTLGLLTEIGEPAVIVLFALISGGIVLNVLKEELPEERESRFWAFAAGTLAYSVLLIA